MDGREGKIVEAKLCRAIDIKFGHSHEWVDEFGWWKVLWGRDIFVNDVPILKTMVLANAIVWIIMVVGLRMLSV